MLVTQSNLVASRLSPWIAALLGFAFTLWTFYPGYMSYDSAYQWLQARHGTFDTLHPPVMAILWQLTDRALPGPGGMLVTQSLLYWTALAALTSVLPLGVISRFISVLFIGFWPPLFGLLPHIWKDVLMMAAFGLTTALLRVELEYPKRWLRVAAVLALSFTCMLRHNAILGAVPLAVWIAIRELAPYGKITRHKAHIALLTLLITGFLYGMSILPNYMPNVRRVDSLWSLVALWDIAAVSLSEERLLFPVALHDPSLTLEDLRKDFMEAASAPLYASGKLKISLWQAYTPDECRELEKAWLSLLFDHTRLYLQHRWRLTQLLFGWDRASHPDHLVFEPGLYAMPDNPPIVATWGILQQWVQSCLNALINTPLFAGWWYVVALLVISILGLTRLKNTSAALATVVSISALAYALPLTLISGSTDFRYLSWLLLATPIAALLLVGTKNAGTKKIGVLFRLSRKQMIIGTHVE
jgi:hypothetical protein